MRSKSAGMCASFNPIQKSTHKRKERLPLVQAIAWAVKGCADNPCAARPASGKL